jgi:hypothetical protein
MNQLDLLAIFDECIGRLRRGDSVQTCLADYPEQAGRLAPELALSADLLALSPLVPAPESVQRGYERMMAAFDAGENNSLLARLRGAAAGILFPSDRRSGRAMPALRAAMIAVAILLVSGSFVITAAAEALRLAGQPRVDFAGNARPAKVFATLAAMGCPLLGRHAFPDHHRYPALTLQRLAVDAERAGAMLVTTEKDAMKLRPYRDAYGNRM